MKKEDVFDLAASQALPGGPARVLETHLSWVLLNDEFAFKIKKPLKFSFVDYHLRAQRRYYSERELLLNRRYAPSVYLGVNGIGYTQGEWAVGADVEEIVDYGLQMKRLDNDRQMDYMLAQGTLTDNDIRRVADTLAAFHKRADKIAAPLDPVRMIKDFDDITMASAELTALLGAEAINWIENCRQMLPGVLAGLRSRLQKRAARGWRVDGHGDLHAGNVFIYPREVLFFDAIEFNDSWRQVDVLDELAFLSIDLDYFGRTDLQQVLWQTYQQAYPTAMTAADTQLFQFFQYYRASVRLKIAALMWRQTIAEGVAGNALSKAAVLQDGLNNSQENRLIEAREKAARYFELMQAYWEPLSKVSSSQMYQQEN